MSGIPSYLRRTEDLKRLKTRSLYIQGADGTLPGTNTLPVFGTTGNIQFSDIEVIGGDSMVIPGDLTVDGTLSVGVIDISSATFLDISAEAATFQDLSVNSIWTNTEVVASRLDICGSAAVLGGLSIGRPHGVHELDVAGHIFVNSDGTASRTLTIPGIYTIPIPAYISSLDVELIGAGGFASNGGGGGYIRGTVDVSGLGGQTLTIQVGSASSGLCTPSSSSYLTFLPGGPLLAIAGAGGNGFVGTALGVNATGGVGGGGVFTGGVAAGGAGGISGAPATAGAGGTTVGGAAAASPAGVIVYQTPQPGQGRPFPESYIEASGGTGGFNASCGPAGGSGYAGGGQGLWGATTGGQFLAGGGGGGSSYISTRVSSITSYAGGAVPASLLTGFGRAGQNGCVRISYANIPSMQTTGDILCGGDLDICGNVNTQGNIDICGNINVKGNIDISGTAAVLGGLSIGKANGVYELDVVGHVFVDSNDSDTHTFTVPGIYTVVVPASVATVSFEMIGSGGSPGFPGSVGGGGGYMRGTMTGVAGKTLTVQVGGLGFGGTNPSTASYITIPGTGPLYAIAGAGGNGGGSSGAINGGAGGGGAFYAFGAGQVSNGSDGVDTGTIPGSRGRGASSVGGAGGSGGLPGTAGANPSGTFIDAVGGASNGGGSGGGGFAGGGGGASTGAPTGGGGGGSSFYNSSTTTVALSYAGSALPAGVLPGYGRSGQNGYVSIFYVGQPSLQTTSAIVCGGALDICGNLSVGGYIDGIRMANSFYYRQPSGGLFRVPQRVLVDSSSMYIVTSSVSSIDIDLNGPPFDTLKKIEVEINGILNQPSVAGPHYLYWGINNTTAISTNTVLAQNVSDLYLTTFVAKHTFELSKNPSYLTKLINYGSYEAMCPANTPSVSSGVYHPANLDVGSQYITSLELSTTSGITAAIHIDIYAYV